MIHWVFGNKKNAERIRKSFEQLLGRTIYDDFDDEKTLFFADDETSSLRKTTDESFIRLITTHENSRELELVKTEIEFIKGQKIKYRESGDIYIVDTVSPGGYMLVDRNGQMSYLMKNSEQCAKFETARIKPRFNKDEILFDDHNNVYCIDTVDEENEVYRVMKFKAGNVLNMLSATFEEIPFDVLHNTNIMI